MTTNQSNTLAKNPNTKKAIAVLQKFAQKETEFKQLKKESEGATELIKQAMIDQGITKIDVDLPGLTGYITLAERTSYSTDDVDDVDDAYTKRALDSTKVKAQHTLTGQLPVGVVENKSTYITKKFKVVE